MLHSPEGYNSQGWAGPKPGASAGSPTKIVRVHTLGLCSVAFLDVLAGSWIGNGVGGT